MNYKKLISRALAWLTLVPFAIVPVQAGITTLPNGDKISWDGNYYDFRDSAGVQMIKLWVPHNIKTLRGVFISGHGGGGGDSRNFARDQNIRALAVRLGFGVAGLHNFPGRTAYEKGAKVFFQALNEFSKIGDHPEIANLPFVMYGSSNGGASTYGFVNYAPERAICFVANVSAGGSPEIPVKAALNVPGVFILGQFDALIGQRGIDRTQKLMKMAREQGARWSWAIELKGHEDGASFDLYMKLVEEAVKLRYPLEENPLKGKVRLKDIKEESGWLVDESSWGSGLTRIAPYPEYKEDKASAGWVLNESIALVYRGLATYHNPLRITIREFDRTFNPHTDPGTMFSLGGPVASPGDIVTIECHTEEFADWQKVEFFNGATKLGEVSSDQKPELSISLNSQNMVYCLTVLATDRQGIQRTSTPMHFFVKDPALVWDDKRTEQYFNRAKANSGSVSAKSYNSPVKVSPTDSLLVAYGLAPEQEAQFSSTDGIISAFWKSFDENKDCISLTQRINATRNAVFSPVITNDCNLTARAAYGSDGIYLLIEINDDNDVFWPNEFAGTPNEQFYSNFDVVDMLIDSRSIDEICMPGATDHFISKSFGLTSSTRQYQVACGTPNVKSLGFHRSMADPWDFNAVYFTFEDARKQLGLEIENIKTDYYHKCQEWFIPWSEVGGGVPREPVSGTKIGFSIGFNDRDEGEHFPPGVTSSGGSVKASNALRWVNKSDPWNAGPLNGQPPYNWGEIELGPSL